MPIKNLVGMRFVRLVVISRASDGILPSGRRYTRWKVRCDCGKTKTVATNNIRNRTTASCGCKRREATIKPHITHGEAGRIKTPEYRAWIAMRNRVNNPNQNRYGDYGGRGISICKRWDDYENFLSDVGRRPSPKHSLERDDNDGNYNPDNCRWATAKEQRANQRKRLRLDQFSDDDLASELIRRGYYNPLRVVQHH